MAAPENRRPCSWGASSSRAPAVVLLSIVPLRSQGHCSSRATHVAPQELGSKVGIAPQELGKGWGKISKIGSQLWSMYGVFHDACISKWNGCHEISYVGFPQRMRHN